ncbi:MAG: hypothetical protein ACREOZ_02475, partial [Gloeomargaritales cyanobacterium]
VPIQQIKRIPRIFDYLQKFRIWINPQKSSATRLSAAWMCLFAHPHITCREAVAADILNRLGYEEGEIDIEIRRRNQNFGNKGLDIKTDVLMIFLPTNKVSEFTARVVNKFYGDGITTGPSGHIQLAPLISLEGLSLEETQLMVEKHNNYLGNTWIEKIKGLENLDSPGEFTNSDNTTAASLREYVKKINYSDETGASPLFLDVQQNGMGKTFLSLRRRLKAKLLRRYQPWGKGLRALVAQANSVK